MKLSQRIFSILEAVYKIPDKYLKNDVAMDFIKKEIQNMLHEIKQSEKGSRAILGYGVDKMVVSNKSTFPDYLQQIFNGAGTVKKFEQAVKLGKGPVWNRIALEAIDRLENGYKNMHGYDEPDQDFIDAVLEPVPF